MSFGSRLICRFLRRRFSTLREMAGPQDAKFLYEPKFPDTREYPEYALLNVRIQGYDFTYVEKFQGYVDRMARRFNFKVVESYAVAAQTQRVVVYKPNGTIIDNEVKLALYDRVVRISNVAAPHLQLFITLVETHLPVGVTVTFKQHEKSDEDYRYIPDLLLKQKQEELKSLDNPVERQHLVPYELVDIGANLGHPCYKQDWKDVLKRARRGGHQRVQLVCCCVFQGTVLLRSEKSDDARFYKQVDLACELKKLVYLYEREAHNDMVDILSEVFLWKDRLQNGVRAALRNGTIPLDRILIETDASFRYPKINDKKLPLAVNEAFTESTNQLHKFASFNRNDPCTLVVVCEAIAAFTIDPKEVPEATTANSKRVYG